jgi:hypothetical protein
MRLMAFNKNVSARLPELEELNRPHNQTSILFILSVLLVGVLIYTSKM